jgi:transposase
MAGKNISKGRTYAVGVELTDEQWLLIADLFPEVPRSPKGGRPPIAPRPCLEAIIWMARSGAQWKKLPKTFAPATTCWRRLQRWIGEGTLLRAFRALAWDLELLGGLDWSEGAGDATFVPAVKGGTRWASLKSAKAPRSSSSATAVGCQSAS